jgi:hypothetical protein
LPAPDRRNTVTDDTNSAPTGRYFFAATRPVSTNQEQRNGNPEKKLAHQPARSRRTCC